MSTIKYNGSVIASFGKNTMVELPCKGKVMKDNIVVEQGRSEEEYTAGQTAEYNRFWDAYQKKGAYMDNMGAFAGTAWSKDTFKPKYSIRPLNGQMLFWSSYIGGDLAQMLYDCGVQIDLSKCYQINQGFAYSTFTRIPELDLTKTGKNNISLFNSCYNLVTIDKLIVSESNGFLAWFNECPKLTNLTIQGTIAQNDFDVSQSPLLTHDSLVSIITALKDISQNLKDDPSLTDNIVTLGKTNAEKLTSAEIAIARYKGWKIHPLIEFKIDGKTYYANIGDTWIGSGLVGSSIDSGKEFYLDDDDRVRTVAGSNPVHLKDQEYRQYGYDVLVDGGEYITTY